MQIRFLILALFCLSKTVVSAQNSPNLNAAEILHAFEKLNTLGSVLYIAAHPDDENTRLLGYLSNERKYRTAYLSLTRGDGGQNLIGKEQGDALGLIRTQELLAARRTDGAEQFFTRANDFGYSKNPEETFTIWNKDSILSDVVWAIRRFKPDVIICRFPTTGEGGHGHHTASALLAEEAFDLAADPTKFPEQLKYVSVWQAKRLFWNTFNFGGNNTTSPDQLKIDVGNYNPLLGKSYGEIAAESRSMHKSQGFGSAKSRGEIIEYFKQLKGDEAKIDLFEGINTSWKRINQSLISDFIQEISSQFSVQYPARSLQKIALIYKQIQAIDESDLYVKYWKQLKLKECETVLLTSAGLWFEVYASDYSLVPGEELKISTQLVSRLTPEVRLNSITSVNLNDSITAKNLTKNQLYSFTSILKTADTIPYSTPYWLQNPHTISQFFVEKQTEIGKPENAPAFSLVFDLTIAGIDVKIARGVLYKNTDPVKGEVYRPLEILPPVSINISDKVFVFSDLSPKEAQFVVKANQDKVNGTFEIKAPAGWEIKIKNPTINLSKKGDELLVLATLTPTKNSKNGTFFPRVKIAEKTYSKSITRIEYDHIPYQFILEDAAAKLVYIDLKKTGKTVGYIPGAGDEVAASLRQVGYTVIELTDELLNKGEFAKFDAIVTGIRAYNVNERLFLYHEQLMEYVKNGGNLIVQYNTNNRNAAINTQIGPYPFTISRNRVTDEKAAVRFINPTHAALNFPNKISQTDFNDWVQERGIYFATNMDSKYETLVSMNDPNEEANDGSLIIGKYGKGNFVYTGIVFFRELPAGIPGAYRLFVNLLSLPKN